MKAGRITLLLACLAAVVGFTSLAVGPAQGTAAGPAKSDAPPAVAGEQNVGLIVIANRAEFGKLDEAPVVFDHQAHTQAMEKAGKDCLTCHPKSDKGELVTRYQRVKDLPGGKLKDMYHTQCVACHRELSEKGQKAGPVEAQCRSCHSGEKLPVVQVRPAGMDPNIHARHVKAAEEKCETCHHKYDEKAKKLVYVKGEEEDCRYCHGLTKVDNKDTFKKVSHDSCVPCHFKAVKDGKVKGTLPMTCDACHTAAAQSKYKRFEATAGQPVAMGQLPRLKRNQPDVLLLGQAIADKPKADDDKLKAKTVPFNHEAHERAEIPCRTCHHSSLASCGTECHTVAGSEKGKFITLGQAMHKVSTQTSCVGCHDSAKKAPECWGCHVQRPTTGDRDGQCANCHTGEREFSVLGQASKMTKDEASAKAKALLDANAAKPRSLEDKDIPEKVTIKGLSDKYEAAEFPHRKIVRTLEAGIQKSKMAAYYHADPLAVCQGCHHHSEPSKNPPACSTCHRTNFDAQSKSRVGLLGAYHQQCIGCHTAMQLPKPKATDCTDSCHKPRAQQPQPKQGKGA